MPDRQRFFDNTNAPEHFAHGLQSVEVMGPNVRFTLYTTRRDDQGQYRETIFTCIMPLDQVGPAIALTLKTIGTEVVLPAMARAATFVPLH